MEYVWFQALLTRRKTWTTSFGWWTTIVDRVAQPGGGAFVARGQATSRGWHCQLGSDSLSRQLVRGVDRSRKRKLQRCRTSATDHLKAGGVAQNKMSDCRSRWSALCFGWWCFDLLQCVWSALIFGTDSAGGNIPELVGFFVCIKEGLSRKTIEIFVR